MPTTALESWKLHPEAIDAHPGTDKAHPGTDKAHPGDMKAHPGDMKAHPGDMNAHPEDMKAHHGVAEAHSEAQDSRGAGGGGVAKEAVIMSGKNSQYTISHPSCWCSVKAHIYLYNNGRKKYILYLDKK